MTDSELITRSLIGGTVNAAILVVIAFLLSRFVRDSIGRVGLHSIGAGRSFTPVVWAISCITFDLVVAAYVVIAYRLIGARRMRFRDVTSPQASHTGS